MDNDGLPHTLEHLIFLGSEDYPYKEVLDLLANRALADRCLSQKIVDAVNKNISSSGQMHGQTQTTHATPCILRGQVGSFTSSLYTWTTFSIPSSGRRTTSLRFTTSMVRVRMLELSTVKCR